MKPGLEDEFFSVSAAQKLSRTELMEFRIALQDRMDGVRAEVDLAKVRAFNGVYSDSNWFSERQITLRRCGRQMQWIAARFATIKDQNRAREQGQDPAIKEARRRTFLKSFFDLCRKELDRADFKELCDAASIRSGEDAPDDSALVPNAGGERGG